MNILLKNIDVITVEKNKKVIKNAIIGIKNGLIEFIDDCCYEKLNEFKPDRVIDGKNCLVMPGLINTHTHTAMTLLRNYTDDLSLEEWLFKKIFPIQCKLTTEDIYWGTMLGIAEMIKSGTTTFADMYLYMDSVAQAVMETGIRANISKSPIRFNVGANSETLDESEACYEFYKKWNNSASGRIKACIEVHSTYLFDERALKNAAEIAKRLNTGILIHLSETRKELDESIARHGMSPIEMCLKYGIFDVPVVAAHCVHLSDNDMDILKQKNVNVAHNPTSNLKLGSGIARIPLMLNKGINVTLGTDGAASNNNLNIFEEMHIAALMQKGINLNPELMNAEQVINMATLNGAEALGYSGEIGCIKKGMKADLIILDTDKLHLYPMNDHISAIVYSAQAADVDTVIIDGNIIMEKRQLKTIDEVLVKYKVKEIQKRILS